MPDLLTAASFVFKPVAETLLTRLVDVTVGKDASASIAQLKSEIVTDTKRALGIKELEPNENQDINCAIALAFVKAGKGWLTEVSEKAEAIGNDEDKKFCVRMRHLMQDIERDAAVRKKPVEQLSQPKIIQSLLETVPEGLSDAATLGASTDILTKAFKKYLEGAEGEPLPSFASNILERRSGQNDERSLFGHRVLNSFIDILKQGGYPQATKAFEFRLFGELRQGLKKLHADLETVFGDLPDQITQIDTNIWLIRRDLAQMLPALARHRSEFGSAIEARLIELQQELTDYYKKLNTLPLDAKPAHAVALHDPYINMRFEQRGTAFVGREEERDALEAFLNSDDLISWWQVSGAGGQGKSRLGLHMVDNIAPDWHAGFLGKQDLEDVNWNNVAFVHPTLIIIDYLTAPGKAQLFADALRKVTQRTDIGSKVRFLILEREGYESDKGFGGGMRQVHQNNRPYLTKHRHAPKSLSLQDISPENMIRIANSWRSHRPTPLDPLSTEQSVKLLSLMGRVGETGQRRAWRPLFAMMIGERIDIFAATLAIDDEIGTFIETFLEAVAEDYLQQEFSFEKLKEIASERQGAGLGSEEEKAAREAVLKQIAALKDDLPKPASHGGIGHNRPPKEFELQGKELEEVAEIIETIETELTSKEPNVEVVAQKTSLLMKAAGWAAGKIDTTVDAFCKSFGETLGTTAAVVAAAAALALPYWEKLAVLLGKLKEWLILALAL